jgi:hypothetical protein
VTGRVLDKRVTDQERKIDRDAGRIRSDGDADIWKLAV